MSLRLAILGASVIAAVAGFAAPAAAETVRIVISDLVFAPEAVTVRVGDVIEWVNRDFIAHTATDRSGAWDVQIEANATAVLPIIRPGTFAYFCKYHPNMTGTLIVRAD